MVLSVVAWKAVQRVGETAGMSVAWTVEGRVVVKAYE
jgi:hypothetical protein